MDHTLLHTHACEKWLISQHFPCVHLVSEPRGTVFDCTAPPSSYPQLNCRDSESLLSPPSCMERLSGVTAEHSCAQVATCHLMSLSGSQVLFVLIGLPHLHTPQSPVLYSTQRIKFLPRFFPVFADDNNKGQTTLGLIPRGVICSR